MARHDFKKPPFSLDRTRRGDLVEQISAALRKAIETGYYRPGDVLPPVRPLATLLGVSKGMVERALAVIREEGLTSPRPRIGSVVCARNRPLWKGQVLVVVPPGIGNLSDNAVHSIVRDALTAAGYLPMSATVPRTAAGTYSDFALLETTMRQQVDFVVLLHDDAVVTRWLSRRGVPFARMTRDTAPDEPPNCVGSVRRRDDLALAAFVSRCREAGVGSVLQVTALKTGPDAVPALEAVGIAAANWRIPPPGRADDVSGLTQRAADEFAAWLAGKRRRGAPPCRLPDLLFFRDDHLAAGALLALAEAGVRTPRDVRVVSWANRDHGPASLRPLARMEMDIAAIGETLARCVLDYLRTGSFPQGVVVGPTWIDGETI